MNDCEGYDGLTEDKQVQVIENMNHKFSLANFALAGFLAAIMLSGLVIVFIWKR
jgi:hypothetical protein